MGIGLLREWRPVARSVLWACALALAACDGDGEEPDGSNPDNMAPIPQFSGGSGAVAGQAVALDASGSRDSDGAIVAYRWRFGDGNNGTGASVRHTYPHPGTYQVTLTVTDDAGAEADTSRAIVVSDPNPVPQKGNPFVGEQLFSLHCINCHQRGDPFGIHDMEGLIADIETTMPPGNASACDRDCAEDIAAFIATW